MINFVDVQFSEFLKPLYTFREKRVALDYVNERSGITSFNEVICINN